MGQATGSSGQVREEVRAIVDEQVLHCNPIILCLPAEHQGVLSRIQHMTHVTLRDSMFSQPGLSRT